LHADTPLWKSAGRCNCGSSSLLLNRCATCPTLEVEHARAVSPAGRLLERVLELDFDTQRFSIDWADVTAEEAMALKVLVQERDKWTAELRKREQDESEMQRQVEAAQAHAQRRAGG
jgi:hypothetical protein